MIFSKLIGCMLLVGVMSCTECPECYQCPKYQQVSTVGKDIDRDPKRGRKAIHRPGEFCKLLRLDPTWKYDDDNDESELEWLKESCYQAKRFRMEYIQCRFGKPDYKIYWPLRVIEYYPCKFSLEYEKLHGSVKEN